MRTMLLPWLTFPVDRETNVWEDYAQNNHLPCCKVADRTHGKFMLDPL